MPRLVALFALMFAAAGCATPPEKDGGCANPVSEQDFFGAYDFSDLLMADYFAKAFAIAGEPSFTCRSSTSADWRLTYSRYNDPDVIIHASRDGDTYSVRVIEFRVWLDDGVDNWKGQVVRESRHRLSAAEWGEIEQAARAVDFWNQPRRYRTDSDLVILHSPIELIEGRAEHYHTVDPESHTKFLPLMETLKRLARVD